MPLVSFLRVHHHINIEPFDTITCLAIMILHTFIRNEVQKIEIILIDGTSLVHCIEQVRGDSRHPISRDELLGKFYDNSQTVLDEKTSKDIVDRIIHFEDLPDIKGLVGQLASI